MHPPDLMIAGLVVEEPVRSILVLQMAGSHTSYEIELQALQPPPKLNSAATLGGVAAKAKAMASRKQLEALASKWVGKPLRIKFPRGGAFTGFVTRLSLSDGAIRLTGYGQGHVLDMIRRTRAFVKKSVADVVKKVAGKNADVSKATGTVRVPFLVQYHETDFEFLLRLASYEGFLVYDTGSELVIGRKPKNGEIITLNATELPDGNGDVSVEPASTAMSAIGSRYDPSQPLLAKCLRTPDESADALLKTACSAAESLYGKRASVSFHHPVFNNEQLKELVAAKSRQAAAGAVEFRMATEHPGVRVGAMVLIKDHPFANGKLFVTAAEIAWDQTCYRCRFTAVPEKLACGPGVVIGRLTEVLLPAIVADSKDPKKLGRVKLRFPWDDETPSLWVRVVCSAAGERHGSVSVPRPGDEVLVGFEYGDPTRPVVLGALYSGKSKPPLTTPDPTNEVVLARTARGTEIRVIDEEHKEEVVVRMAGGKNEIRLVLGSKPRILIRTVGECRVEAKSIALVATDDMTIEGKTVTVSAKGEMQLKAGGNAIIRGAKVKLN